MRYLCNFATSDKFDTIANFVNIDNFTLLIPLQCIPFWQCLWILNKWISKNPGSQKSGVSKCWQFWQYWQCWQCWQWRQWRQCLTLFYQHCWQNLIQHVLWTRQESPVQANKANSKMFLINHLISNMGLRDASASKND